MKAKFILISIGIATALWIIHPLVENQKEIPISHPVRVEVRDIEALVFGDDPETDFVPATISGDLVISPEDMFYETMDMLARCVEAEAGNQGLEGKRLVVDVILNRVKDPDFPDTIKEVITQEYHFSSYWNGAMDRVSISEETWQAIEVELDKVGYPGVIYFREGDWPLYGTPWRKVGDHYFSTK